MVVAGDDYVSVEHTLMLGQKEVWVREVPQEECNSESVSDRNNNSEGLHSPTIVEGHISPTSRPRHRLSLHPTHRPRNQSQRK
jgi:hypothetical protein